MIATFYFISYILILSMAKVVCRIRRGNIAVVFVVCFEYDIIHVFDSQIKLFLSTHRPSYYEHIRIFFTNLLIILARQIFDRSCQKVYEAVLLHSLDKYSMEGIPIAKLSENYFRWFCAHQRTTYGSKDSIQ